MLLGYAVGVRSEVVLPASVLNKPLTFEVIQESSVDHIRLCRVEVEHVGLGHPCTLPFKNPLFTETQVSYSKSVDTMEYFDSATVNLGHTCPVDAPNDPNLNASLVLSFYYEIPSKDRDSVPEKNPFVLGSGLYTDSTALWTTYTSVQKLDETIITEEQESNGIYTWNTEEPQQKKPYMTARILNENGKVSPWGVLAIRFVIKLPPYTRGTLSFSLHPSCTDCQSFSLSGYAEYTCSLRVVHIGRNYGCAKSPEEYTRTSVKKGKP